MKAGDRPTFEHKDIQFDAIAAHVGTNLKAFASIFQGLVDRSSMTVNLWAGHGIWQVGSVGMMDLLQRSEFRTNKKYELKCKRMW
mmetsp:Transcript_22320/g.36006  ORF Transcript_22320/g.36006 Transcript_22320/m.36006 type:complete len:85 (+) Transcript_22320:1657-1911(+)